MSVAAIIGLVVGIMALVADIGATFYWGGKIVARQDSHDNRLKRVEDMIDRRAFPRTD